MKALGSVLLLAVALLSSVRGLAQSPAPADSSSSAFGVILLHGPDSPVRHARVEFFHTETGWAASSLTDDKGQFRFSELSSAIYRITVTAPGCERFQFTASINGKVGPLVFRLHRSASTPAPRNNYTVSLAELRLPGKAQHSFQKGTSLLLKGDLQGSLPYFRSSIEQAPDWHYPHHNLAIALYKLGQLDDAEKEFQTSIDLTGGGFAPSLFGISMILFQRHDFQHAESVIQNGLLMDPASSVGKYCLGLVQFSLGRLEEAERSAHDALARSAMETDAYILLAKIHERLHNPYAVVTDVQTYLKLDPHGPLHAEAADLLQHAQLNLSHLSASLH